MKCLIITDARCKHEERNVVQLKCTFFLAKGNPPSCSGYSNWMAIWLQLQTGTRNAVFTRTMFKIILWNREPVYFRHQSFETQNSGSK